MKISLVVASIRRTTELASLLQSLEKQESTDFEVIIVDQNQDDRLIPILRKFGTLNILHMQIEPRGVSNARNLGVQKAKAELIGFPDDDCTYFPETISQVIELCKTNNMISGRCISDKGKSSVAKFSEQSSPIHRRNVWNVGVEATMFMERKLFNDLGGFNEALGVGSPVGFGAGEGTDLILRHLDNGGSAHYHPELVVYHPEVVNEYNEKAFERAYSYGKGIGKVLQLNNLPIDQKLMTIAKPAIGATLFGIAMNWKRSKYYYKAFRGRLSGYLS